MIYFRENNKMTRIKLNLFESIVATILLPNIGFIFTTIALIVSLVVKQEPIVYSGIAISYLVCLILLVILITFCFLVNRKSKKEIVFYGDRFEFCKQEYLIEQISSCEYYVCKWYAVPVAFIYKQQVAGLIDMKLSTGEKIKFKIFYNDYLKLKNYIKNIIEK